MSYMEDAEKKVDIKSCQNRSEEIMRELTSLKDKDNTESHCTELMMEYELMQNFHMENPRLLLMDMAKAYLEDQNMIHGLDYVCGEGSALFIGNLIMKYYE